MYEVTPLDSRKNAKYMKMAVNMGLFTETKRRPNKFLMFNVYVITVGQFMQLRLVSISADDVTAVHHFLLFLHHVHLRL